MKRHALFVGVDEYADGHIPNLSCAVSDATDLHGFFKFGAGYDDVRLLQNPAGKKEVLAAVRELTADLGKGDFFLFFFAGHGFRVGENHVLVCSEDLYDDVKYEEDGLPLGQLKRRLSGPFDRAILLDACQSDILATRGGEGLAARDLSLILEGPPAAPGEGALTVVTSCDAGQTAGELAEEGHGLFTLAMLSLLEEARRGRARLDLSDSLRMALGARMREVAAKSGLRTEQRPRFSTTGNDCPALLDGAAPAPRPAPATVVAPVFVVCPLCGRKNEPKDTFRCCGCGRDNLCLRHQDEATYLCEECAAKARPAPHPVPPPLPAQSLEPNPPAAPVAPPAAPSPSAGAPGGASRVERILALCKEEQTGGTWQELYVGDGIPAQKLANFRASATRRGLDERGILAARPIALCDATVFGSAKNGFLFTEKGIAVSGDWTAQTSAGYLTWEEFAGANGRVERKEGDYEILLYLHDGRSVFFNTAACGRKASDVASFFRRVREAN